MIHLLMNLIIKNSETSEEKEHEEDMPSKGIPQPEDDEDSPKVIEINSNLRAREVKAPTIVVSNIKSKEEKNEEIKKEEITEEPEKKTPTPKKPSPKPKVTTSPAQKPSQESKEPQSKDMWV
jgi:hypothetical protein